MRKKMGILLLVLAVMLTDGAAALAAARVGIVACGATDPRLSAIIRQNNEIVEDPLYLYDGDCIPKQVNLEVSLETYGVREDAGSNWRYREQKPGMLTGLWQVVKQFFDNEATVARSVAGVARGPATAGLDKQYPQPGYMAALLPGRPVTFAWGNKAASYLVFFDRSGREIARRDANGRTELTLRPEEAGLRPGQSYTWQVSGLPRVYQVTVLTEEVSRQILAELSQQEQSGQTTAERRLQQVAYLQMISDLFPGQVDLYWLSYQLLNEADGDQGEAALLTERFKLRFARHLNGQL